MLYAHWTANTYQVTFDAQGGNEIAPMSVRADEVVTDLPTPERTDYAFDGWYTKADGGKKVTELSTVKDVTLYAHWKLSHYTLTFDSQGGTEVQPITENIETPFTSMPITTKTNYVFTGWYTKPEGGIRVTSVTDGKSMKLYAHWSEATYVLTFNANGGDSVPAIRFAATEGVPASVMDMSFANQALGIEYLVKNQGKLPNKLLTLPEEVDYMIANIKLDSMGVKIDTLTPEQEEYLNSWKL